MTIAKVIDALAVNFCSDHFLLFYFPFNLPENLCFTYCNHWEKAIRHFPLKGPFRIDFPGNEVTARLWLSGISIWIFGKAFASLSCVPFPRTENPLFFIDFLKTERGRSLKQSRGFPAFYYYYSRNAYGMQLEKRKRLFSTFKLTKMISQRERD